MDESVVRLNWDGGQPWVSVAAHWRNEITPAQLTASVVQQFNSHRPGPESTRAVYSAQRELTWEDAKELGHLRRSYNQSRRAHLESLANQPPEPGEHVQQNVSVFWHGGRLVGIQLEGRWLERATAQTISDQLTEALTTVPEDQLGQVPDAVLKAKADLEGFWNKS